MTPFDFELLHRTVDGEARGESQTVWVAVTWVIKNRSKYPAKYGASVAEVCLKPYAFSAWVPTAPGTAAYKNWLTMITAEGPGFETLSKVVDSAWAEDLPDLTYGSTHYHAASLEPPHWTEQATRVGQIGNLIFYSNVP